MKKTKALILIPLIVILVASLIYLGYEILRPRIGIEKIENIDREKPVDETANWPSYTDARLNRSIKYPKGWSLQSFDNGEVFYKKSDTDPGSLENSYIKIIEGEFGHGLMGIESEKKITISLLGDNYAEKWEYFDKDKKTALVIIEFHNQGKEYSLEFNPSEDEGEKDIEIFEQFLTQNK